MEPFDKPELRLGQVKGFYISEKSIMMHLASHTHGYVIPWNILNFILGYQIITIYHTIIICTKKYRAKVIF